MGTALKLIAIALIGGTFSAGCSAMARTENPRAVWCKHNHPRRDATADTLRTELDEINGHNAKGARWCGWKP